MVAFVGPGCNTRYSVVGNAKLAYKCCVESKLVRSYLLASAGRFMDHSEYVWLKPFRDRQVACSRVTMDIDVIPRQAHPCRVPRACPADILSKYQSLRIQSY